MLKLRSLKLLSFLWLGSLAGAGMAFLTQVIIARFLDVAQFGSFSSALATVTLVAPLAGIGVPALWLKVFGGEGWQAVRWVRPSFIFVVISTSIVVLGLYVWGALHHNSNKHLLMVLSVFIIGQICSDLVSSKLQLEEHFSKLALWQIFPHLARFTLVCLVFLVLDKNVAPIQVGIIYAFVSILCISMSIKSLIGISRGRLDLKGHVQKSEIYDISPTWKMVASQSWPFGVGAFAHLIYFQSDIILLNYLVGNEAAGSYNVAFTVMTAVYLFPSVLYQKYLLPKIHRWSANDRGKFYLVYRKGNMLMLLFGAGAMVFIWLISEPLILLVFGEAYRESIHLLRILAVSAPLISIALSAGATLVTSQNIRIKVKYMLAVAVFNLILNFIVIPTWGNIGAAYTTLLSNLLLLILYLYGAERKVFGETHNER
ncbi:flippase [Pseudomonas sp. NY15372]|uniref:flippase n=1 Tax=Pseudomonas sp. NY15372 TaxID=3400356 RepID=UPI003A8B3238